MCSYLHTLFRIGATAVDVALNLCRSECQTGCRTYKPIEGSCRTCRFELDGCYASISTIGHRDGCSACECAVAGIKRHSAEAVCRCCGVVAGSCGVVHCEDNGCSLVSVGLAALAALLYNRQHGLDVTQPACITSYNDVYRLC